MNSHRYFHRRAGGSRPPRSRRKASGAGGRGWLAMVLCAIMLALGAPAHASVETDSRRIGFVLDGAANGHVFTDLYLGSYSKQGSNDPWFCIEFGAPITVDVVGAITEESGVDHRRAAYLIGRYGGSTSAQVHAAVALAVHDIVDRSATWQNRRDVFRMAADALGAPGTSAMADGFVAESQTNFGSWTIAEPVITLDHDRRGGTVSGVSVRTASGIPQDVAVTLTLDSALGASWVASGTPVTTVQSNGVDAARFVLQSGGGIVNVLASYAGAPAGRALVSSPPEGSQDHAATAEPETIGASARRDVEAWAVRPFAVSVANPEASAGAPLIDALTIALPSSETWPIVSGQSVPATFTVDWFSSPTRVAENSPVPNEVPYSSQSVTVAGVGAVMVTAPRAADASGYYYPVARFSVDAQPEEFRRFFAADWTALLHEPNEQTLVPWQPRVETETSQQRLDLGQGVADVLTVQGNEPHAPLTVESTLWGPLSAPPVFAANPDHVNSAPPVPDGTPMVATLTTVVVGNATVTTAAVNVSQPGYYVWTERVAATPVTVAWNSDWATASEVSMRVYEPLVATVTSQALGAPGQIFSDLLTVTGNDPQTTVVVTSILYGPFDERPALLTNLAPQRGVVALPPGDVPAVGAVETTVTGNGLVRTPGLAVSEAGYYVWVESFAATDTTAGWAADFGQADEISLVQEAVLASTTSTRSTPVLGAGILLLGAGLCIAVVVAQRLRRLR